MISPESNQHWHRRSACTDKDGPERVVVVTRLGNHVLFIGATAPFPAPIVLGFEQWFTSVYAPSSAAMAAAASATDSAPEPEINPRIRACPSCSHQHMVGPTGQLVCGGSTSAVCYCKAEGKDDQQACGEPGCGFVKRQHPASSGFKFRIHDWIPKAWDWTDLRLELKRVALAVEKLQQPIEVKVNMPDVDPDAVTKAASGSVATASFKLPTDICARPKCESPRNYNIHDPERGGHEFVEPAPTPDAPPLSRQRVGGFKCPFCGLGHSFGDDVIIPAKATDGLVARARVINNSSNLPLEVVMDLERHPKGGMIVQWGHRCEAFAEHAPAMWQHDRSEPLREADAYLSVLRDVRAKIRGIQNRIHSRAIVGTALDLNSPKDDSVNNILADCWRMMDHAMRDHGRSVEVPAESEDEG